MSEESFDIRIDCGADFSLRYRVQNDEEELTDLTDAVVRSQLRPFAEAADSITFRCSHNGSGGTIVMRLSHEETAAIRFMKGVYDVFIDYPDGNVDKVLQGAAIIIKAVTKEGE